MFEKYNQEARRALFFARYEASKLDSQVVDSEHILLGILREGEETVNAIFRLFRISPGDIRRAIDGDRVFRGRISSPTLLPLSADSKKIIEYASQEADNMRQPTVRSEHLLIGALRVEGCAAARILTGHSLDIDRVRKEILASYRKTKNE